LKITCVDIEEWIKQYRNSANAPLGANNDLITESLGYSPTAFIPDEESDIKYWMHSNVKTDTPS